MKFYIKTFGCQMNLADSDLVQEILETKGYTPLYNPDAADLMVVNTCTVREHAENRALSYIGRCASWKNAKTGRKLVVMGCVAERLQKTLKHKNPFIDLLISSKDIEKLPTLLDQFGIIHTRQSSRTSQWITIMRGCNNYCTYCIVPYVRGRERSIPADEIIRTVQQRVASGIHEIILLGQNVNSYVSNKTNFARLLACIAGINGIDKVSCMTSHPKDFNDEIINTINAHPNISRDIHLPVQSGSNKILKLMNRGYTKEEYLTKITRAKNKISGARITTDIIVGFPGEEETDFNETVELIETAGFSSAYVFKYSERAGTKAADYTDSIPREVKERRHAVILNTFKKGASIRAA
ncbi:MAG: tRNA (N6-isopentenyl adenosine(37)-C2)-methylthiotransferase MiaB [bacterium]